LKRAKITGAALWRIQGFYLLDVYLEDAYLCETFDRPFGFDALNFIVALMVAGGRLTLEEAKAVQRHAARAGLMAAMGRLTYKQAMCHEAVEQAVSILDATHLEDARMIEALKLVDTWGGSLE